ncbi:hypothetical protein [Nocardia sp. NPDC050412]|uniref:hypothetical protein n=1 Tax=Nocardia sp. NPDC050412 TaxID=3364320 RepID=UPI0037B707A6
MRHRRRGLKIDGHEDGFFTSPSLLDHLTAEMDAYQDELRDGLRPVDGHPLTGTHHVALPNPPRASALPAVDLSIQRAGP